MSHYLFCSGSLNLPETAHAKAVDNLMEKGWLGQDDDGYFWKDELGRAIEGFGNVFENGVLTFVDNYHRNFTQAFKELAELSDAGNAMAWNSNDHSVIVAVDGETARSAGLESFKRLTEFDSVAEDFFALASDEFEEKYVSGSDEDHGFSSAGEYEEMIFTDAAHALQRQMG